MTHSTTVTETDRQTDRQTVKQTDRHTTDSITAHNSMLRFHT